MEDILHHLECINLVNNGINYLPKGAGFLQQYPFIWVLPIFQWIPWGLIFRPLWKVLTIILQSQPQGFLSKTYTMGKWTFSKTQSQGVYIFFRCFSFFNCEIFPSPKNSAILGNIESLKEVNFHPSMPQLEALAVARCGFPTWRYQRPRPSSWVNHWAVGSTRRWTNLW